MCDEISTECVRSRVNSLNISIISLRTTGSSPLVGSSSMSSFASCERADAIPSFIFIPAESFLKAFFLSIPKRSSRLKKVSSFQREYVCFITEFSCNAVITAEKAGVSITTPISSFASTLSSAVFLPSRLTVPPSLSITSSSSFIVVLLPAPFSPIRPIIQPVGKAKLTSLSSNPALPFCALYFLQRPFTSIAFTVIPPRISMYTFPLLLRGLNYSCPQARLSVA